MGPKNNKRSRSNSDDDNFDPDRLLICKACKKTFKSVLTHIERAKTNCKSYYPEEEQLFLKQKSTKRSKQSYDKNNAESISKKKADYYSKNKVEIRQTQAAYKESHRNENRQLQARYLEKNKAKINFIMNG